MSLIRRYPYAVFLAIDLLASALTFGAPWQTISARLGKAKGLGHWSCRALDWLVYVLFGESQHCETSLVAYEARINAVSSLG